MPIHNQTTFISISIFNEKGNYERIFNFITKIMLHFEISEEACLKRQSIDFFLRHSKHG
jgi:hypothetical protein